MPGRVRASWRPWRGPWQVCFVPAPIHWTMRFRARTAPFQHVFLMQPQDDNRWLVIEWTFMQHAVTIVGETEAAHLHAQVTAAGALIAFEGARTMPRQSFGTALWPTTCVGFVRSVMGLSPRHCFYSARQLWCELLELGGTVVVEPPQTRPAGRLAA